MRRPQDLAVDEKSMATIVMLTNAFEGLASMRIAQIKNQVLQAQQYFSELWDMYHQIRVDSLFRYGRQRTTAVIEKELYIAITAEGGFSGDIDQRLIHTMLETYDPSKHDIVIVGHHGALQLTQAGIKFKKYYKLPTSDININVTPLVAEVAQYRSAYIYYQQYASLMTQNIKRMELSKAIQELGHDSGKVKSGKNLEEKAETINENNHIFEPDPFLIASHLERSMMDITLSQSILDSKLAQYASRFRAMRVANDRSSISLKSLHLEYNRAKRSLSDERLKEIINGIKKSRATV